MNLRIRAVVDANTVTRQGVEQCVRSIEEFGRPDVDIAVATHSTADRILIDAAHDVIVVTAPTHGWTPDTLPVISAMFTALPELDLLFGPSDDAITPTPWSLDRLRRSDYLGGVIAIRGEIARRLVGVRTSHYPHHRWDLVLRLAELDPCVSTSPLPLGRRLAGRAGMLNGESVRRGCEVLNGHLLRCGVAAVAEPGPDPGAFVVTPVVSSTPNISVVVPSVSSVHVGPEAQVRHLETFLSYLRQTIPSPHQTIVITADSVPVADAKRMSEAFGPTTLIHPTCRTTSMKWRYLDEAATHVTGDVVIVVDDDVVIASDDGLRTMASIAMDPSIGAVAALAPAAAYHGPPPTDGSSRSAQIMESGCIAMRTDLFARLSGLLDDPSGTALPVLLRRRGLKAVVQPVTFSRLPR